MKASPQTWQQHQLLTRFITGSGRMRSSLLVRYRIGVRSLPDETALAHHVLVSEHVDHRLLCREAEPVDHPLVGLPMRLDAVRVAREAGNISIGASTIRVPQEFPAHIEPLEDRVREPPRRGEDQVPSRR